MGFMDERQKDLTTPYFIIEEKELLKNVTSLKMHLNNTGVITI